MGERDDPYLFAHPAPHPTLSPAPTGTMSPPGPLANAANTERALAERLPQSGQGAPS